MACSTALKPLRWVNDEHCLAPMSFIDYPALDLLLDTVQHPGREKLNSPPSDLRFSSVTALEFINSCERSIPPQMTFNLHRALRMLESVLPALLELRDRRKLPGKFNLQTFPKLVKLDFLQVVLHQGDLSPQSKHSLHSYLVDCDDSKQVMAGGLGRHTSALMGLTVIFFDWAQAIDDFMARTAIELASVKADYSRAWYRMALQEYAGLADHVPNLHESRLVARLREAGEVEADFLPYFSLAARGAAFSNDLGL